jgi:hypothetical protein
VFLYGSPNTFTVPEMKEYLIAKDLPSKGTKAFLAEILTEYFTEQNNK